MATDYEDLGGVELDPSQDAGLAGNTTRADTTGRPMVYLWEFGPDACPIFLTIALSEDIARQAVVDHPEIGGLVTSVPDYLALITGPPTKVIEPGVGAAWVINWRAEDRIEVA